MFQNTSSDSKRVLLFQLDVIWWNRWGWGADACARYTDFLLGELIETPLKPL